MYWHRGNVIYVMTSFRVETPAERWIIPLSPLSFLFHSLLQNLSINSMRPQLTQRWLVFYSDLVKADTNVTLLSLLSLRTKACYLYSAHNFRKSSKLNTDYFGFLNKGMETTIYYVLGSEILGHKFLEFVFFKPYNKAWGREGSCAICIWRKQKLQEIELYVHHQSTSKSDTTWNGS